MVLFYGNLYVFHMMESICFYFMWKRTHFPSRDFIQQEVLNSRKTGSFKILGKADSLFKPQNATAVA